MKEEEDRNESGRESAGEMKDPMSGYASADELDPRAHVNPEQNDAVHSEKLQDAMSGYASADALGKEADAQSVGGDVHVEETRDSMSGYASADELEREA